MSLLLLSFSLFLSLPLFLSFPIYFFPSPPSFSLPPLSLSLSLSLPPLSLSLSLGLLVELDIDYDSARLQHPREAYVKQFTFNAARKSMTTVVSLPDNKGSRVLTKGASELVLSKCTSVLSSTGEVGVVY